MSTSPGPKRRGPPNKIQDEEQISWLVETRALEQVSWKDLAKRYQEKYGEKVDWRTVRDTVISEAGIDLLPRRFTRVMKAEIEQTLDRMDLMQMVTHMLSANYAEWRVLNMKMFRALADDTVVLSEEEGERMNKLGSDIMDFYFKVVDIMQGMKMDLDSVMGFIPSAAAPATLSPGAGLPEDAAQIIEEVGERTRQMLEAVNEKHRRAGEGHYRRIEEDDDLEL